MPSHRTGVLRSLGWAAPTSPPLLAPLPSPMEAGPAVSHCPFSPPSSLVAVFHFLVEALEHLMPIHLSLLLGTHPRLLLTALSYWMTHIGWQPPPLWWFSFHLGPPWWLGYLHQGKSQALRGSMGSRVTVGDTY